MRLRAVLSAGELCKDSHDYFGSQLNEAYWLLNSDELRTWLKETAAPLAFMVSEGIYKGVVRPGYPQVDPAMFEERVVKHKKGDVCVWVSFPESADFS
jgi:hypothetical protein